MHGPGSVRKFELAPMCRLGLGGSVSCEDIGCATQVSRYRPTHELNRHGRGVECPPWADSAAVTHFFSSIKNGETCGDKTTPASPHHRHEGTHHRPQACECALLPRTPRSVGDGRTAALDPIPRGLLYGQPAPSCIFRGTRVHSVPCLHQTTTS